MVIDLDILKKVGPTSTIVYAYIKEQSKLGSPIKGVRCSPIKLADMVRLGIGDITTVKSHVQKLAKLDMIVVTSPNYPNSTGPFTEIPYKGMMGQFLYGVTESKQNNETQDKLQI